MAGRFIILEKCHEFLNKSRYVSVTLAKKCLSGERFDQMRYESISDLRDIW